MIKDVIEVVKEKGNKIMYITSFSHVGGKGIVLDIHSKDRHASINLNTNRMKKLRKIIDEVLEFNKR